MTTIAERKLNIIRQVDELTEESLIEVEKLIAKLKANQATSDITLQEQAIHLKAEDMAFFLLALENPPKANEALKETAHWHKQLISHA